MQIDDLARRFPEAVRQRGAACQRAGAVTVTYATPSVIRAVALGTEEYDVQIAVEYGTLVLSCSCPAFERDGPCKHLWATALVADERRMLAAMPAWTKVELAAEGDDEDDDDQMAAAVPSRVVLRQPPGSRLPLRSRGKEEPPPSRSRAAAWETLFFPSGSSHSAVRSAPVSAPAAEILYVVEVEKTRHGGELTVSLRTRTARKKG